MLVLPFTPLRRLEATPVEAVPPLCSGELQQAVVTVSRGGAVVTVDPSEGRFSWPGKIGLAKFVRDWTAVPAGTPMPLDLVIAFREGSVPSDHPSAFYLPHSAHMPLNARLVLCLDNAHHIDVGNFVFERVVTFAPRPLHG